jgi:hypothetical protein
MSAIIKKKNVRQVEPGAQPSPAAPLPRRPQRGKKKVELLRVQGRVRALELTCSCGEKTVVELGYGDEAPGAPGSGD